MTIKHYIVMPTEGLSSERIAEIARKVPLQDIARRSRQEVSASSARSFVAPSDVGAVQYEIVASFRHDGPQLIEMTPQVARVLRESLPSALVEPNRRVFAAVRAATKVRKHSGWAAVKPEDGRRIRVLVKDQEGKPVRGARVLVFAAPDRTEGIARRTRPSGLASFVVPKDLADLPRIVVEPPPGYRSLDLNAVAAASGEVVMNLPSVDPQGQDGTHRWRAMFSAGDAGSGKGVRVAIVDSGVNVKHPDLAHASVHNVFEFDDDETVPPHPHANHVAGLIGARGPQFRGIAPDADLFSFRFTALGKKDGALFGLGEAITRAAEENVHLINVSMASGSPSEFLSKAAAAAFRRGAVCIAAAGNDGRDRISFPAASKRFFAVTAYGDRSVLARGARELDDLSSVISATESAMSRAKFSNYGPDTDFMGPGVGLISCGGEAGYAIDSGTSFATPVIVGLAAAILSKDYAEILAMAPDGKRATAITQVLTARCHDLGFDFETQGSGIIHV